jgi:hypothetical protein
MGEFQPVEHKSELDLMDSDDMMAGYMAGLNDTPEPGSAYSRSYWHGWRNGMADKGRIPSDHAMQNLATEIVRSYTAH